MELKEFISETLISIISGVSEAQKEATKLGAHVNPTGLMRNTSNIADNAIWDNSSNNYAQPVSFDIAVTVEDKAQVGAKIKVIAAIFGADAEAKQENKDSLASRVQFIVPILLPEHDIEKPEARQGKKRGIVSNGVNN